MSRATDVFLPVVRVTAYSLVTFAALAVSSSSIAGERRAAGRDLPQDYTSARAWLEGDSPYRPLSELLVRYGFPPPAPDVMVRYNPHPPVAILLTAPYAKKDFVSALWLVTWTQLLALAITWALCYELFRPNVPGWIWAVSGGLFGFWTPVWQGWAWGQPVGLLALATLAIWWLARTERAFAFGVLLAATILVRPFVAILVVLAIGWSSRQQVRAAVGLLLGGSIPFAAVQVWPWEWYHLASDAGGYVAGCGSIPGVLNLGAVGGQVVYALALGILAGLRWRGLPTDTTAALAAVAAMLAYPLAWFQYDTCLIPVVAWVVARITTTGNRVATWSLLAYLALRMMPDLVPTPGGSGLTETLAHSKSWIQVFARGLLLGAVVAVAPVRGVSERERGSS